MVVIVSGDVMDGIDIYGPFDDEHLADSWGYKYLTSTYHVVNTIDPNNSEWS